MQIPEEPATSAKDVALEPQRSKRADRVAIELVLLLAVLVFFLAARDSSFLDLDSGPYLSMAHHTRASGVPRSSFLFLGGADQLPGFANFAPPGVGFLIGLVSFATGSVLTGARALLLVSLLVMGAVSFLMIRRYARPTYAALAAGLLVASPVVVPFAAQVLSELPFMAAMLLATWAGARVLAAPEDRRRWFWLVLLAGALPLLRYLGLFFVPAFLLAFLLDGERRLRLRQFLLPLFLFGALAALPLAIWFGVLAASGVPVLPPRPAALLGWPTAVSGALVYLLGWSWPFLAGAALVWLPSRWGTRQVPGEPAVERDVFRLPAALLVCHLAVLIAARTQGSYYPLYEIGLRYMSSVWPLAFLAGAAIFYQHVWRRRSSWAGMLAGGLAAAGLVFGVVSAARIDYPETYPALSATMTAARSHLPEDAVVLANFGQSLAAHRPHVRVLGLPSREDLSYDVDLSLLIDQHGLGWVVLLELPSMRRLYGDEVAGWLRRPPQGVKVLRTERYADGVIYQIARPR